MEIHYLTAEEARQIFREELEAHDEKVREAEKERKAEKVTRKEALRRIGRSETTLWHYNNTGYLPAHREEGGPSAVWYYEIDVARVERERGIKKDGGESHE